MQKNVAGQIWHVFAFGGAGHASEGQPITGDAANITANLRLDSGAANAVDDTNPAEKEDGYYTFDITQAETNANVLLMTPESSTANVEVIGVPGVLYTTPPNFVAMGIESDGDLTKCNLVATTTANTDMRGTDGVDTATMRGTDSAALASVATESRLAELDPANLPTDIAAIPTTTMRGTDGVDTATMRGTDSAALASVATEARLAELDPANLPTTTDATLVDTGTTIPAQITALNDISVTDILTTQMAQSYAADGVAPTLAQALFLIQQILGDFAISGTTLTVREIDGATTAATFTLDSATIPTSLARTT